MTVAIAFALSEFPFVEGKPEEKIGYTRKIADQFAVMCGGIDIVWIDETKSLRKTNKNVVWSWEELFDQFPGHRFVFLTPQGNNYLDEFEHPKDNIIYCIGHDATGFGELDISKAETLKLRTDRSCYAITVFPFVVYDRFVRSN